MTKVLDMLQVGNLSAGEHFWEKCEVFVASHKPSVVACDTGHYQWRLVRRGNEGPASLILSRNKRKKVKLQLTLHL